MRRAKYDSGALMVWCRGGAQRTILCGVLSVEAESFNLSG